MQKLKVALSQSLSQYTYLAFLSSPPPLCILHYRDDERKVGKIEGSVANKFFLRAYRQQGSSRKGVRGVKGGGLWSYASYGPMSAIQLTCYIIGKPKQSLLHNY